MAKFSGNVFWRFGCGGGYFRIPAVTPSRRGCFGSGFGLGRGSQGHSPPAAVTLCCHDPDPTLLPCACCHAPAAPASAAVLCPPCRDFTITRCRDMWVCLKNLTAGFWQKSAAALCRDLGAADFILGLIFGIPAVTHPGSGLKAAAVTTWASSQIPVPDSATSWRVCPCHAHTVAPNNLRHQTSPFNGSTAKPTRKNKPPKSGRKGQTLFPAQ